MKEQGGRVSTSFVDKLFMQAKENIAVQWEQAAYMTDVDFTVAARGGEPFQTDDEFLGMLGRDDVGFTVVFENKAQQRVFFRELNRIRLGNSENGAR